MNVDHKLRPELKIRRVNLDTGRENIVVISRHSRTLRPEVFRGFSRVELQSGTKSMLATLLITDDDSLVGREELGLAEPAFRRFACPVDSLVSVTPAKPPESLEAVRAKILGRTLDPEDIAAIIGDITRFGHGDRGLPRGLGKLHDHGRTAGVDAGDGGGWDTVALGTANRGGASTK